MMSHETITFSIESRGEQSQARGKEFGIEGGRVKGVLNRSLPPSRGGGNKALFREGWRWGRRTLGLYTEAGLGRPRWAHHGASHTHTHTHSTEVTMKPFTDTVTLINKRQTHTVL